MANATFEVGGVSVDFDAFADGYDDQGHALEEWKVPIRVFNATDWGALFSIRTPREFISVRTCPSVEGATPRLALDVGGGAGRGSLTIDGLDAHTAILTDLSSSAPFSGTDAERLATATFLVGLPS